MKYGQDRCPQCGKQVEGHVDWTPGTALVQESDEDPGVYEYTGTTRMGWDGVVNDTEFRGVHVFHVGGKQWRLVELQCEDGHQWTTTVEGYEE